MVFTPEQEARVVAILHKLDHEAKPILDCLPDGGGYSLAAVIHASNTIIGTAVHCSDHHCSSDGDALRLTPALWRTLDTTSCPGEKLKALQACIQLVLVELAGMAPLREMLKARDQ